MTRPPKKAASLALGLVRRGNKPRVEVWSEGGISSLRERPGVRGGRSLPSPLTRGVTRTKRGTGWGGDSGRTTREVAGTVGAARASLEASPGWAEPWLRGTGRRDRRARTGPLSEAGRGFTPLVTAPPDSWEPQKPEGLVTPAFRPSHVRKRAWSSTEAPFPFQ